MASLNAACVDRPNGGPAEAAAAAPPVRALLAGLARLRALVDAVPPLPQAMRYGNKAFREWHARMLALALPLAGDVVAAAAPAGGGGGGGAGVPPAAAAARVATPAALALELAAYLVESFGSATRLDYGTGHETAFVALLAAGTAGGVFSPADAPALATVAFPAYLSVARALQRTYWLEPAGSHGVWSLDDYHLLPFLFGSAQLLNHARIRPRDIHSADLRAGEGGKYMYLAAVDFIASVKTGAPFAETSPILNDVAELPHWARVNEGLAKMYRAEVLGKLPVAQHFTFGALVRATWAPSRPPAPSEAAGRLYAMLAAGEAREGGGGGGGDGDGAGAGAPEGGAARPAIALATTPLGGLLADTVPVDSPDRAVAPWATSPPAAAGHAGAHAHRGGPPEDDRAPWAGAPAPASVGSSFHAAFPGLAHHAPKEDGAGGGGAQPRGHA